MEVHEKMDERTARKVSLAQERNTRVIIVRTTDTHRVLDIVTAADRGIRILRSSLLIKFQPEEVVPLIKSYQEAVKALHLATVEICRKAGIPYRPPRGMQVPPVEGSAEEAREEKHVDDMMEMAYSDDGEDGRKKKK